MKKLNFMLWLALVLPWSWWQSLIWKSYFEKRVMKVEVVPVKEPAVKSIEKLITVYVPEARRMTFEQAARLAVLRDEEAADRLKMDAETQLKMERAAAICRLN